MPNGFTNMKWMYFLDMLPKANNIQIVEMATQVQKEINRRGL